MMRKNSGMPAMRAEAIPLPQRRDPAALAHTEHTAHPALATDDDDAYVLDASLHEMNYYVVVVLHADVDKRPCNPVVQVVHLTKPPQVSMTEGATPSPGVEILLNCQLCGPSVPRSSELRVNALKVCSVFALSLTDLEANIMINNVNDMNQQIVKYDIGVSQRSNLAFLPRFLHRSLPLGLRSIVGMRFATSATDVQLAVLLLRESLNESRSVALQLERLHPFLATPSNLQDAIGTFTRKVHVPSFLRGTFKFHAE